MFPTLQRNPYAVLGATREASDAELKRAYRSRSRAHHPDRGGDPAAFREVQEAWEVLGDVRARAAFDAATVDAGAELMAAFERARQQVERPAPGGRSRRDEALLATATDAGVLGAVAVLAALVLDVTGALGAAGADPVVLLSEAVLFVLLPALLVALLTARTSPAVLLAGTAAGLVAVRAWLDPAALGGWLAVASALLGAGAGSVAVALRRR